MSQIVWFITHGLRRSWPTMVLFGLLYTIGSLQFSIYLYSSATETISSTLLAVGYHIGVWGYILGVIGMQFLLARHYRYEMGNLETLGFTRLTITTAITAQFCTVFIVASLAAQTAFQILYFYSSLQPLHWSVLLHIHWISITLGLITVWVTMNLFLLVNAHKEPLLLMKEHA